MFETKNNSRVIQCIFTACFICETTNRRKFRESGGYTLEKIFSTDLHELENSPKRKWGGNLPLSPGGATASEEKKHMCKKTKHAAFEPICGAFFGLVETGILKV